MGRDAITYYGFLGCSCSRRSKPLFGKKITLWGSAGNDVINGSDAKDFFTLFAAFSIFGSNGNDQITGDTLDDYLDGGAGNDKLYGGKGNDTLVGGEGNDLLDGGEGSDHMEGGAGFDTYYIDGNDTVYDSDGIGKIIFSGGLLHSEATAANFVRDPDGAQDIWYSVGADGKRDGAMIAGRIGQDLKITRAGDTVFLRGFFDAAVQQNGTFSSLGITLGTAQEAQPDTPLAETLTANGLDGQYNTFYLGGGKGNDWLYGGAGDDTYRFAAGDGADWIRDEGGSDSLHFTGLDSRKATWRREGSHLAIYGENGDVVRIHDYFAAAEQRIEHLHFSDRTLDHPDFAAHAQAAEGLIQAMAVFGSGGGATSASADTAAVLQPLLAASSL